MRLTNGKLNPQDVYDSEIVGTLGNATIYSSSTPMIGIAGKGAMTSSLGLGFVSLNPQ